MTAYGNYSRRNMQGFLRNNFKHHYLKKKELFLNFLLHFWNGNEMYNILKKKDEYCSLIVSEIIESERGGYLKL